MNSRDHRPTPIGRWLSPGYHLSAFPQTTHLGSSLGIEFIAYYKNSNQDSLENLFDQLHQHGGRIPFIFRFVNFKLKFMKFLMKC
jgi:hypothetical protein